MMRDPLMSSPHCTEMSTLIGRYGFTTSGAVFFSGHSDCYQLASFIFTL